ncbi:MAG: hypothetical protein E7443_07120 [Ruminococcaceae bacterium]|nr:hypothetical protein [Oscillospiraceae bacterium]
MLFTAPRKGNSIQKEGIAIWLGLMLSMLFRFFPSSLESLGCQKEFAGRYVPSGKTPRSAEVQNSAKGTLRVPLSWLALNGLFFFAHWKGWVSDLFLVCLAAFYSMCDIICTLFFCPFQSWMMHNRCCAFPACLQPLPARWPLY